MFALLADASLGTLIICETAQSLNSVELSYLTTQLWQRRTLKASLGIHPVGLEVPIPRIGMSEAFRLEVERPAGCEVLGCELRIESEPLNDGAGAMRLFAKKAPRRSSARVLWEALGSRNVVFRSQERTRFAHRMSLGVADVPPWSTGSSTVWMSFQRESMRPAILGVGTVLVVLLALVS